MLYAIHACAPNDRNGNPRRCYLVYRDSGEYVGAVDEGYCGDDAIGQRFGTEEPCKILCRIPTTPAFRRDVLRESR